jgi:hypothetical protein
MSEGIVSEQMNNLLWVKRVHCLTEHTKFMEHSQ